MEVAARSLGLGLPPRLADELAELAPRPDGETTALEAVRGYAPRGTAGWTSGGSGWRAYNEGLEARRTG